MAAAEELDPAELALVVQLLDEQVLAAVDDGLHHHVDLARGPLRPRRSGRHSSIGRGHRHRAGDVLARLERGDRSAAAWSGIGELMWTASTSGSASEPRQWSDLRPVAEHRSPSASSYVSIAAAIPHHFLASGWCWIDRNEFGAESKPDDGNAYFLVSRHVGASCCVRLVWRFL